LGALFGAALGGDASATGDAILRGSVRIQAFATGGQKVRVEAL